MFDGLKNIKNLMGMLGQADEIKAKMEQFKEELAKKTVEAESGAGAVRVVVNGRFEVVNLELDQAMIASLAGPAEGSEADKAMVEELITSAINAGMEKAREMAEQEMMQMTSGMNLPGMDKLFGGGE
jgi:DNA-binding YbaB/EbfC family protein